MALAVAEGGLEKKALNVVILDVRGRIDYADYVVVMAGRSDRQVQAIARGVEEHLGRALGREPLAVEGRGVGQWVLMDYGDVVVHVFHEDARGYYDLESFWLDAARVPLPAALTGAAREVDA
ncbi:MAG: ribosome silencing factor [Myxococcota bacterium]|nr:ribosome silencing factor [Myxococcota bacterium]MDW8363768.1 ribosome silencing factor [Myxococcales bacterium]